MERCTQGPRRQATGNNLLIYHNLRDEILIHFCYDQADLGELWGLNKDLRVFSMMRKSSKWKLQPMILLCTMEG